MDKLQFRGSFEADRYRIEVALLILSWVEEDVFYTYSPTLDLTGYGKSEMDAKDSFKITLNEFIRYANNKGTLFDELEHLGWAVNRKKRKVYAPEISQLREDNEEYRRLEGKEGVKSETSALELVFS